MLEDSEAQHLREAIVLSFHCQRTHKQASYNNQSAHVRQQYPSYFNNQNFVKFNKTRQKFVYKDKGIQVVSNEDRITYELLQRSIQVTSLDSYAGHDQLLQLQP